MSTPAHAPAWDGPLLVTGASGFLGRYVIAEAQRRGLAVVDFGRARFPSAEVAERVQETSPGAVIHLAGPSSVPGSIADPHADFTGIVGGTECLLDALRRHAPHARVVFASSAAVYGDPPSLPVTEDAPPAPLSPYGYHKAMAELLVEEASRLRGAWGAVARIFSAYGPGFRRQVVYDLCAKAARGEPLVVDGTGEESRDFVHGADVATALVTIALGAPGRAERYNVASGVETTTGELARTIAAATPGAGAPRFTGKERAGDPKRWRADVTRLAALGFAPRHRLDAGVREVLAWLARPAPDHGEVL